MKNKRVFTANEVLTSKAYVKGLANFPSPNQMLNGLLNIEEERFNIAVQGSHEIINLNDDESENKTTIYFNRETDENKNVLIIGNVKLIGREIKLFKDFINQKLVILLIAFLSFTSISDAQQLKENSSSVGWMLINENTIALDKQAHFTGGAFIGTASYSLFYSQLKLSRKESVIYSTLTGLIVGALKEWSDSNKPNNKFDFEDLAYTVGGTFVASITVDIFNGKRIKMVTRQPKNFVHVVFENGHEFKDEIRASIPQIVKFFALGIKRKIPFSHGIESKPKSLSITSLSLGVQKTNSKYKLYQHGLYEQQQRASV